jgi:hypothetical protein
MAEPTTNEKLRDDVIWDDVQLRKVTASVDIEVQARLTRLDRDLTIAMQAANPFDAVKLSVRRRKQFELIARAKVLIRRAYEDCLEITQKSGAKVAKAQAASAWAGLEDHIP